MYTRLFNKTLFEIIALHNQRLLICDNLTNKYLTMCLEKKMWLNRYTEKYGLGPKEKIIGHIKFRIQICIAMKQILAKFFVNFE